MKWRVKGEVASLEDNRRGSKTGIDNKLLSIDISAAHQKAQLLRDRYANRRADANRKLNHLKSAKSWLAQLLQDAELRCKDHARDQELDQSRAAEAQQRAGKALEASLKQERNREAANVAKQRLQEELNVISNKRIKIEKDIAAAKEEIRLPDQETHDYDKRIEEKEMERSLDTTIPELQRQAAEHISSSSSGPQEMQHQIKAIEERVAANTRKSKSAKEANLACVALHKSCS